jgi:hypothetical protein
MKRSVLLGALMLALAACGDDDGGTPAADAGPGRDSGVLDAGAGGSDAATDARTVPPVDAGGDAALRSDAGLDASSSDGGGDAATDASTSDARVDAGSADASTAGDAAVVESFAALYADIIGPKCSSCHNAEQNRGMLNMASAVIAHQQLVGVNAAGGQCASSGTKRVLASSADTSLLVLKVRGVGTGAPNPPCGGPMPPPEGGRTYLDAQQVARIARWIAQGAENN